MILVTGSRRRLGRVIARTLARQGNALLLHAQRAADELDALAAALRAEGAPSVEVLTLDFAAPDALDILFTKIQSQAPQLRAAVFNAAVYPHGPLQSASADEMLRTFQVNAVFPILALTRLATLPAFDRAVFVTDARASGAWRHRGPYLASKAALESLLRTAALELAPSVAVHGVAPGPIALEDDDPELRERILARLPLGALVQPDDVARVVALLMEPSFSSTTGTIWPIDAGRNLDK